MSLFQKRNKPTKEDLQQKAAQDLVPIKAIDSGMVLTPDNRLVQILKIGAVNTQLMSSNELYMLLENYEAFLKSLSFSFQLEVVAEPVDLKKYVRSQEEMFDNTKDFNRRNLLKSYIEYAKGMETSRQIIRRQRYIIFDEKIRGSATKDYETAMYDLEEKRDQVISGLKDLDLPCEALSNTEIVRFFHIFFNYEGALNQHINPDVLQPITDAKMIVHDDRGVTVIRPKKAVLTK